MEEICDYIEQHDRADHPRLKMSGAGSEQIGQAFSSLSKHPRRGNYPLDIGIREYREIFFKPYRIIYRVMGNNPRLKNVGGRLTHVLVSDGRRDIVAAGALQA